MATFSLAPKPDPNSVAQKLHDHYWNVMHRASFKLPGTWFQKMGTNPAEQMGELTNVDSIYQNGLDYCKDNNITVILDDEYCKKRGFHGIAYGKWKPRTIGLASIAPDVIKFKYQHYLPRREYMARIIWHEIAHIELGHDSISRKHKPKSVRELEAEMVCYLVCLYKGHPHFKHASHYISGYFRQSHALAKKALQSEVSVIRTVVNILGSEAQHGR